MVRQNSFDFEDSIFLVSSNGKKPNGNPITDFGTAFIIHRDQKGTYLVTCAHVVEAMGDVDNILVHGSSATVVNSGKSDGFDIAVLRVEDLWDKPLLKLKVLDGLGKSVEIFGYYEYGSLKRIRKLSGKLSEKDLVESTHRRDRTVAWYLQTDAGNYLEGGYSGSPVIDIDSNCVLGIVSHKEGRGERGTIFFFHCNFKQDLGANAAASFRGEN